MRGCACLARPAVLSDYEIQTSFNGPAFLSWSRTYEAAWQNGGVFANSSETSFECATYRLS